ncbi:ArsR/SmtB family transcription factor [Bacteroidota bacterium]
MRIKSLPLSSGAQVFKALSEEPRIRILHLLLRNDQLSITDLERVLDFTQAKTSRHLAYLKNSGIVSSRKIDQWSFYFIKEEISDFVSQALGYLNRDHVLQQDLISYQDLYDSGELASFKLKAKNTIG